MKGIIETSVYLVIFALVCFFSIDFIRINQRVSDAGEISQYIDATLQAERANYENLIKSLEDNSTRVASNMAELDSSINQMNGVIEQSAQVDSAFDTKEDEYNVYGKTEYTSKEDEYDDEYDEYDDDDYDDEDDDDEYLDE